MTTIELLGALELGLVYGLIAIAVYLTFRVIDFPDLTVDGSFPLGAAVAATLIVGGYSPWIASLAAFGSGALAGCVTGYLNVRWKILGLLAGILTMTALYSINLRVMGRPNVALLGESTIFADNDTIVVLVPFVLVIAAFIIYIINSDMGLAVRAAGSNARVSAAHGVNVNNAVMLTLALSNGIVGLAGAIFAQSQGFADVTLGPGTIIVGLASVIIGEALFRTRSVSLLILACIVGSIVYRLAVAFALNIGGIGLQASDLKLITALLIALTMIIPKLKK